MIRGQSLIRNGAHLDYAMLMSGNTVKTKKPELLRYQGSEGRRHLIEALRANSLVQERPLAAAFARRAKLRSVPVGQPLIKAGSRGRELFLILNGKFAVKSDGRMVAQAGPGQYVGEIGLLDGKGRRTAAVIALSDSIVARIKAKDFRELADQHPRLWRTIAATLALRILDGASVTTPKS